MCQSTYYLSGCRLVISFHLAPTCRSRHYHPCLAAVETLPSAGWRAVGFRQSSCLISLHLPGPFWKVKFKKQLSNQFKFVLLHPCQAGSLSSLPRFPQAFGLPFSSCSALSFSQLALSVSPSLPCWLCWLRKHLLRNILLP